MSSPNKGFLDSMTHGSVSRKMNFVTMLASLLTLGLLSGTHFFLQWNEFNSNKVQQLETMAKLIGDNATAAIEFAHREDAEELLASLHSERDVLQAVIYDSNSRPLAHYARGGEAALPPLPRFRGSYREERVLYHIQDITQGGLTIGSILITADTSSHQAYFTQALSLSLGLFCAGMLLTIFLTSRLQRVITHPIQSLSNLARIVSREKNYSHRAVRQNDDEIGSLVDSFNFMLDTVQEQDEKLRSQHKELEIKVAKRTAELEKSRVKAEAASKAKSEFLSTASHELRTPMNAIVGISDIIESENLNEELREYIGIIQKSSNTMLSLINDVLDYSKIESGNLELEQKPFELLPKLEEIVDVVAAQQAAENLLCVTRIALELRK